MWNSYKRSSQNNKGERSYPGDERKGYPAIGDKEQRSTTDDKCKLSRSHKEKKKKIETFRCCGRTIGSRKDRKRENLNATIRRIERLMPSVNKAAQSDRAHEVGLRGCQTCGMDKEDYKEVMESVRIIETLVNGIVEKQQKELLDDGGEEGSDRDESNTDRNKLSNGKSTRFAIEFAVYCEHDIIKHNLKCLLTTLQKAIGDTMVQICYVKTKCLGRDERFRLFNVPIRDLNRLKFQFTNLTDSIISLLKRPSGSRNKEAEVCIACVKEKIDNINGSLGEVLKSGRSLKLMKNNDEELDEKCCSRSYPHVHAEIQNKPIVFKYSQPMEAKQQAGDEEENTDQDMDQDESDT